jgi:hypothetical protein
MTHVSISNIFKLSLRNFASHAHQGFHRNNVYCKNNKFTEHKTISLFNKMAFCSTGQDQEKKSRNFMVIFWSVHIIHPSQIFSDAHWFFFKPLGVLQYSRRHSVIHHRDRHITHLGDLSKWSTSGISLGSTAFSHIHKWSYSCSNINN